MDKRTFKARVLDIILDAIKANCNVAKHFDTSLSSRENGFYFKIHKYGRDLELMIFPNGNLGVKIKECSHADQISNYYRFHKEDDHEALLPVIEKDFTMLIEDYYAGMDYYELADLHIDFTLVRKEADWMDAYSKVRP